MKNDFVARQIESELSSRVTDLPGICTQRDAERPEVFGLYLTGVGCERISDDLV